MPKVIDFLRDFRRFKRQAEAGKPVRLVDHQGHCFTFSVEKASRHFGAGRDLQGKPLAPAPIPKAEWNGNY